MQASGKLSNMFDFLYVCFFYMVPRKAVLGRSQVAVTLLTITLSLFILTFLLWLNKLVEFKTSSRVILFIVVLIFMGSFVLNRSYFLRFSKQRQLRNNYSPKNKMKYKALGIIAITFSYLFLMATSIVLTKMRR